MTGWAAFVGLTGLVCSVFLLLARLSQTAVPGESDLGRGRAPLDRETRDRLAATNAVGTDVIPAMQGRASEDRRPGPPEPGSMSTGALLANVAITQGLFGAVLLVGAWYFEIPFSAFGVSDTPLSTGLPAVAVGLVVGIGLYIANEVGASSADALGVEHDEELRELLAPDDAAGWLVLLLLVLPLIAAVEEFVFRAAIVGVPAAGFGTSPWALAVVSSVAFALGHGAQGRLGIAVTGTLGFALAAAFILTGSFLVVFIAHYLVNALEFVVHELFGFEWAPATG